MNELSLFSGAGGGLLATQYLLGFKTIGYVEIDDYCQSLIQQRIIDGFLDQAPIFGDVKAFINQGYAKAYQGMVDVITAGFPCQPFSIAGKQKGEQDERNLWPETRDTIGIIRPQYIFLENVPNLLTHEYAWTILSHITALGYDCKWGVISAINVGASHLRKRWWLMAESMQTRARVEKHRSCGQGREATEASKSKILPQKDRKIGTEGVRASCEDVGYSNNIRQLEQKGRKQNKRRWTGNNDSKKICDTSSKRLEKRTGKKMAQKGEKERFKRPVIGNSRMGLPWIKLPGISGMANGVADRMDRIKATGEGQVPRVVEAAWEILGE